MPEQPTPRAQRPNAWTSDTPKSRAYEHIAAATHAALEPLSTADKNRVLLALHQLIVDQLDALAAVNHE